MPATVHEFPAIFSVSVNGIDVTQAFNPYLISLIITDAAGELADRCDIVLDDSYGQLTLPPPDAQITAGIGWQDTGPIQMFNGVVDAPTSIGSREGGRLLTLTCTSCDPYKQSKSTQNQHLDQMNFAQAAQQFGQLSKVNVIVTSNVPAYPRPYWDMGMESFLQWGQRTANELGLSMKMRTETGGTQTAIFTPRAQPMSAGGDPLATVFAEVGVNVISWNLTPKYGRPLFNSFRVDWYDDKAATWNYSEAAALQYGIGEFIGASPSDAILYNRFKSQTKEMAQARADSNATAAYIGMGGGNIVMIGEPSAVSFATINITGARPEIDGPWLIDTATHILKRGDHEGYITELSVNAPGAGGAAVGPTDVPFVP